MAPQRHAGDDDGGDAAATQPLLAGAQDTATGYEGTTTNSTVTTASGGGGGSSTFTPTLGALDAFAIVISIVIGSGIFTSPGAIDTNSPSPGSALVVWLVGGILAWTGAATMAELGTAIPGEGGVQPYLRYCFGDVFGFLAAWTWIVAVMPATLAILSIVFVESIYTARGVTDAAGHWTHKLLSVAVVVVVSVANCISTKASTRLNKFFVGTKFVAIAAVVLAGLVVVILQVAGKGPSGDGGGKDGGRDWFERNWFATRPVVNPDGSVNDWQGLGTWEMLGFYSTALYGALWAYSGWDKAVYISAELSAPAKQLPLAINTAIPTIIACFLAANAAYYVLLPWNIVSTTDSVAVTAITRLLGRGFGIVAAVVICLVVAGSLLGNSFVAGRMAVAAANTGWFPRVFSVVGQVGVPRKAADDDSSSPSSAGTKDKEPSDAPINAIILSALLSALYIVLGSFRALVTFNGLGEYTFFFLAVLGAVVLRWREPALERPYKPLVVVPGVFVVVSGFVVVRGAIFAPAQAVVLVGLWVVGLVFYWVRRRWFSAV
ncbi:amino acid/polyamine transporter I [Microdochium trichocladiopsis]|uniref:Amino acid/polyamine transporter I n=1 Tax=Microdochium trichocladiopsis TaxID=1682393 RepID=A0A9P9BR13_9PEZI|nr:amino acid/polyamine transporter I [Microdochium trichocladiopsis]KAH7031400.1 amino acid/polyamine transporter I [Microdochium trichocladiopsis]